MNESNFLLFKAYANSLLTIIAGVLGYLEMVNAVITVIGGVFFAGVSALTFVKLYREQFVNKKDAKH